MILVTGGTGFLGRVLVNQLTEAGYPVRVLIRPSADSPALPMGVAMEVAVSSLSDSRGLLAAMKGVDVVYHLAGAEWRGAQANLLQTDIQGAQAVATAARQSGIDRLLMVSHLGADRASAYPVLKSKAIAEEYIRRSEVDYTILRSAILFGKDDRFTSGLAQFFYALPGIFLLPGDGSTLLQPLWVEDLATCLVWALDHPNTRNQLYEVGGPEYLNFRQIVEFLLYTMGIERRLISARQPYLRALTGWLSSLFPALPVSEFWLDYLATNRTCSLDTVPRVFGLLPSRFLSRLDHLRERDWRREMRRSLLRRRAPRS